MRLTVSGNEGLSPVGGFADGMFEQMLWDETKYSWSYTHTHTRTHTHTHTHTYTSNCHGYSLAITV